MNVDLFTVPLLLMSFINIPVTVASIELFSTFSDVCKTMFWMYYFYVLLLVLLSKNLIVGSFLVCLSIFSTLESFMYNCLFIVGSNISTECISFYDLLTLESVDSVSIISFNPRI